MTVSVECQCGRKAEFVCRCEGEMQYSCDVYRCECGLWHSFPVDAGDLGAAPSAITDGRAPSNHREKPSRAILIGDKVSASTHQGEGVVIAYHEGRLVVAWPPSHHDAGDVWLTERAPENVAKHEEMCR